MAPGRAPEVHLARVHSAGCGSTRESVQISVKGEFGSDELHLITLLNALTSHQRDQTDSLSHVQHCGRESVFTAFIFVLQSQFLHRGTYNDKI